MEPNENIEKMPSSLKYLCILSFIGSGLAGLGQFIMALSLPFIKTQYNNGSEMFAMYKDIPNMTEALENIINTGPLHFYLATLVYIASFIGVLMMWKRKFMGFHIYTIAQCLLILFTMKASGWGVPWGDIFFSGVFVALYALNINYLKNKQITE